MSRVSSLKSKNSILENRKEIKDSYKVEEQIMEEESDGENNEITLTFNKFPTKNLDHQSHFKNNLVKKSNLFQENKFIWYYSN